MIEFLKIAVFIAAIFYVSNECKHALHMFQQNRYELHRYSYWIKTYMKQDLKTKIDIVVREALMIAIFILACIFPISDGYLLAIYLIIMLVITYLNILQEKSVNYIKPLALTARVKRQVAVMIGLNIIYFLVVFTLTKTSFYSLLIAIANPLQWLFIYLMAIITTPIEKMVHNYFLNDAKRILRSHTNLKIIGITGSYGKTSSKHILQEILAEEYYSLMTPGSFNTPMGITITVRNDLQPIHEVFVCEMGADKVGDIDFLMKFVAPKFGLLTTIGPQHLQTFHTLENIVNEKFKVIENLPSDGVGFVNLDNELIRNYQIKNSCKIVSFAIDNEADFKATNITYSPNGSTFDVIIKGIGTYQFETRLLGKHNISNIIAAIAVGYEMGITIEELQRAVSHVKYVEHRLQVKKQYSQTWIDNAFNSNPVGAGMSLEVMKMMPGTRYILTPGLIDLGDKQEEYNRNFGKQMKECVDVVYLIGPSQTKPIYEGLEESGFNMENVKVFNTVQEAFTQVRTRSNPGDTILLENDLPDAFSK